ncbi:MAG: DUF2157 domain-containing protein [Candidatus Omnitrophica bacterium]|nr:DUF2157 domain-containing protein [Candidatus Omnitrophota bacterium]
MIFGLVFWLLVIYFVARGFSSRRRRGYRWLQRELPSWEQKNIINAEQGDAILSLYKLKRIEPRRKMDMVKVLTLIGAIFVGVGVIFFVASNWQRIPAPIKTILIMSVTIFTLYMGYLFSYQKEGFVYLGKSLLLLASLFWGGTIALIGQIYNIPTSQNWFIMLLWAFPIVPIAIFFDNAYVHILASALFLIWNFLYTVNNSVANYYYPIIIFLFMLPTARKLLISRRINIIGLLVASLYCCFYKYEWLSLLVSVGLLIYYLIQREEFVYLYASSLSFIFWTITFFTVRKIHPNFYFFIPIEIILYLTYKDKIRENLIMCLVGLLVWLNLSIYSFCLAFGYKFNVINFIVMQSLAGMVIYIIGIISKNREYVFSEIYKVFGYLVTFVCTYLLSFQAMIELRAQVGLNNVYLAVCSFLIGIMALLVTNEARKGYFENKAVRLELFALASALLVNLILLASPSVLTCTLAANAVLVIFAIINIFLGVELKMSSIFTAGTVIFALFIITRYIDVGWKLKEKSLFFIVGGLIISSLGIFLEKQRRKVIERMKQNE